jgi:hypothetical protein
MSRRQPQPSLRCAVREAPSDCPEFQALCDALQRNDPTVTTVTTDRSTTPDEYGRRLGEALLSNNNSVVSEIDLSLSYLLCESDRRGRTTTGATPLVTWMEHSSSLRTVTIRAMSYSDNRYHALSPRLQQRVLDAVRKNPHIRGFRSYLYDFPLQLLTDYISTPNNAVKLQSLKMYYIPATD